MAIRFLSDIDECASGPCQNGGSCSDFVNRYNCSCPSGYIGVSCEIGMFLLVHCFGIMYWQCIKSVNHLLNKS